MQPIVYNDMMKYLLFRGSSLQNTFLGVAYSFLIYYIVYFSDSYTVKNYVWQLLFFISCGLQRKWAEDNNNVLKYVPVEGKRRDILLVMLRRQTFWNIWNRQISGCSFSPRRYVHELQPVLWTLWEEPAWGAPPRTKYL